MKSAKYYSFSEAIAMLPLLKAYSSDIKLNYFQLLSLTNRARRLAKLTSLDDSRKIRIKKIRERIREQIELKVQRVKRWNTELAKLHIVVCCAKQGRLDVPVYDNAIESSIVFCVTENSTKENIEWHAHGESPEQARKYWENTLA